MTNKDKNKIVDILFDFYDEYQSNEINRPMIPSIYADKILDSLKVKEVNLEIELANWRHNHFHGRRDDKGAAGEWLERITQLDLAKHFFNLGLKAKIMTSKLQQRISVLKMGFWTGLQTFEETEMTLSDAYNQGVDDILEELGLKAQKGE